MLDIQPQFFDIFGALAFIYIIAISVLLLKNVKLPRIVILLLLAIGILGFLIDSSIVYTFFF